eukprot:m.105329 g.105329  ORF g.105329 m.105329 type:complete len:137 (+) comp27638_c0_seq2:380-790(+)
MAMDWALQFFGAAGDLHVTLLGVAMIICLPLSALRLDGTIGTSWWWIMSPLFIAGSISVYIHQIICIRLQKDSRLVAERKALSRQVLLPTLFSMLLLGFSLLLAHQLETDALSASVFSPLFLIPILVPVLPPNTVG